MARVRANQGYDSLPIREVMSIANDTKHMTHQEIFQKLMHIIDQINENHVELWSSGIDEPAECQESIIKGQWLEDLHQLSDDVRDAIK